MATAMHRCATTAPLQGFPWPLSLGGVAPDLRGKATAAGLVHADPGKINQCFSHRRKKAPPSVQSFKHRDLFAQKLAMPGLATQYRAEFFLYIIEALWCEGKCITRRTRYDFDFLFFFLFFLVGGKVGTEKQDMQPGVTVSCPERPKA